VELAAIADPALVPLAVATALGLREESGQPPITTLIAALRPRRLLLVLDNCEHLLDASATLTEALVQACPHVQILATSREALGLGGETAWRVPSLALPDAQRLPAHQDLLQVEAVQLFVERALTAQPLFTPTDQHAATVAQICQRLDGIPLALELAAARLRGLSLDELAGRLDQRFRLLTGGSRTALPRQQTLQAAVDWSYSLLSVSEQALFTRLGVFAGGFTLDAAEAVCAGEPVPAEDVLDLVLRLVDKSLVAVEGERAGHTRYRLLETLRQYGRERLVAHGEAAALYARHFAHYRDVAEQAARRPHEMQNAVQLDRIEAEQENLRQALGWALDLGDVQEGLRLAGALGPYWWHRGYFGEGLRWLGALLPLAATCTAARARALYFRAMLQWGAEWLAGRFWHATTTRRALHEEALAIAGEVGDEGGQAQNLVFLGLAMGLADYTGACSRIEEGLARATARGDRWLVHAAFSVLAHVEWIQGDRAAAHRWCVQGLRHSEHDRDQEGYVRALHDLASIRFQEGDAVAARRDLEECLATHVPRDRTGRALMLGMLGVVAGTQGDSTRAHACFEEKRALWELVGERSGIAGALRDLGWLARREGMTSRARACYTEALGLERDLGDAAGIAASLAGLGDVACSHGDHAQAAARYAEGLAQLHGSDARNERAICLEGLATIAWAGDDAQRAARLCGAAAAARLPDLTLAPVTLPGCAEVIAATRAVLGDEQFAAAWTAGQALTLEQTTALALENHADGG
jgi:non-specific serine/threonine protein kinase